MGVWELNEFVILVLRGGNFDERTFQLRSLSCKFSLKRDFLSWIGSEISPKAGIYATEKGEGERLLYL